MRNKVLERCINLLLGLLFMGECQYLNSFRFDNRIIKVLNTSIAKHAFQRDIDLSTTNTNNWSSNLCCTIIP